MDYVKCHKAGKNFFIRNINRPAIGIGNGGVKLVVQFAQNGNSFLLLPMPSASKILPFSDIPQ